jgi:hypothetical protein
MKKSLRDTFRKIELEQGEASEKYFHDALQNAKDSGRLPPWLRGWSHSEKWSPTDRAGIDFIIWTDRGRIKVNVKSSYSLAKQFERQHRGEGIVAVVVNILERPEVFLGKLISTIGDLRKDMPA